MRVSEITILNTFIPQNVKQFFFPWSFSLFGYMTCTSWTRECRCCCCWEDVQFFLTVHPVYISSIKHSPPVGLEGGYKLFSVCYFMLLASIHFVYNGLWWWKSPEDTSAYQKAPQANPRLPFMRVFIVVYTPKYGQIHNLKGSVG